MKFKSSNIFKQNISNHLIVYKEETYINSQEVIFEIPVEERITTGTIFIQELISID